MSDIQPKPNTPPMDEAYDEAMIQALGGVEHVRTRPNMYIGSTGLAGLHHLVYEVVDNCIDEAMAGYGNRITVQLNLDGSATITDDGRGIPVGMHPEKGVSTLQVVLCDVFSGAKFGK